MFWLHYLPAFDPKECIETVNVDASTLDNKAYLVRHITMINLSRWLINDMYNYNNY